MDLADLKRRFEQSVTAGVLTIAASDTSLPAELQAYLAKTPTKTLTLKPATGSGIVLSGSVLTVTGPSSDPWPVQGVAGATVKLSTLTLTITSGAATTFAVAATGELPITPQVSLIVAVASGATDQDPWSIQIPAAATNVTPGQLIAFGVVGPLPLAIPPELDIFNSALQVAPDRFRIAFFPGTKFDPHYTFGVAAPSAKWEPVKGALALDGVDLTVHRMGSMLGARLVGHIEIGQTPVDIGLVLGDDDECMAFVQAPKGGAFPGVIALARWAFGGDLASQASTGFGDVNIKPSDVDLAISGVEVGLNWRTRSITSVRVASVLTVGGLALDVWTKLPGLTITGGLKDNKAVAIKDLVGSFGLDNSAVPAALQLKQLSFSATLPSSFYRFAIEVENVWDIGPLSVKDVHLAITYLGGVAGTGFQGHFDCVLDIAKVELSLSVDYQGAAEGWTFAGGTLGDSTLHLGDFVADLGKFDVSLPDAIAGIALHDLAVSYQTGTSKFSFGLAADFPIDTLNLAITVAVDVQPAPADPKAPGQTKYQSKVSGVIAIAGLSCGFSYEDKDAKSSVFTASYPDKATGGAPMKIGEFIAKLVGQFSSTAEQSLPSYITSLTIDSLTLSYDTVSKKLDFTCQTKFNAAGVGLDLSFRISLEKQAGGYKQVYGGTLKIGDVAFELFFEAIPKDGEKAASTSFLAAVQPNFKIDLRALVTSLDSNAGSLMPELTVALENALFVYNKTGDDPATYLFGLALDVDLKLTALPLVGPVFEAAKIGGVRDVQALYASKAMDGQTIEGFSRLLSEAKVTPALPSGAKSATVLNQGFNFAATMDLGDAPVQLRAGGASAPASTVPTARPGADPTQPSGSASWFDVKKSIGPVTLERVGVRYENGRVWLLLDADLLLAGLSLGLQGLAVGLKLDDLKNVSFNLDGLSLEFASGPLTIAGGFQRFGGDYLGEAKVKAASFGLTAIGGYAPEEKSFFIFVRLNAPLGGPPFFFITGVAGGFGVNRNLILPPIDDLTKFALLPANNKFPPSLDAKNPGQTLASTLQVTEKILSPNPGANWIAAGLDFTSFEMVDSSALVTVAFGVDFELALLGVTRVTVPKLAPQPIVYLEIALAARFKPSQGLLAVDGRLTPASYIYSGLVQITGGFAFYIWFDGPNAGDFVISIGGYHPRFKPPPIYPVVPRLQLTYRMGPLLMRGQAYFALTPHMLMAGLQFDATWETGPLKAWFSAGVDFLLGWRPFHYEADAYIHIGVSLTLDLWITSVSITVHIGVDLSIWGPPFGGLATIDLDIVSFTINFGADQQTDQIDWDGFKSSFLPAGADGAAHGPRPTPTLAATAAAALPSDGLLCTATVTDGLMKELKAKDASAFFSWIVDADHFEIQSNTLIPVKQADFNGFALQTPFTPTAGFKQDQGAAPTPVYDRKAHPNGVSWTDTFGVLPMGLGADAFKSGHTVSLKRAPEGADYTLAASYVEDVNELGVGPRVKPVSSALWAPSDPGLNGARLVNNALSGLVLSPEAQQPDITFKADLWAMLFDQNQKLISVPATPVVPRADDFQAKADGAVLTFKLGDRGVTCQDYKLDALTDAAADKARKDVVTSLNGLGFNFDIDAIDVADLATYPLWDWPMIRKLGEEPAAA